VAAAEDESVPTSIPPEKPTSGNFPRGDH
jgi:hypothetical protein